MPQYTGRLSPAPWQWAHLSPHRWSVAAPLTAGDAPLAGVPLDEDGEDDEDEAGGLGEGAASGSGLPVRRRLAGALGATLVDERHAGHAQAAASASEPAGDQIHAAPVSLYRVPPTTNRAEADANTSQHR